ncbi:acid protease [Exidia glandulosa HHB12029]|uniref:Acid protease n=1 Tax=Exidia glandulosa HHB12029 TaxID=1314781 RepID=A0A166B2F0_EXIGL|nr:acid protease [Exidia glandulosa HHB12029]
MARLLVPVVLALSFCTTLVASVSLPVTKRVDRSKLKNLAHADRARVKALLHPVHPSNERARKPPSVQAQNTGFTYTVDVGVGEPATTYSLIVDTGSSNTWVGADPQKPFVYSNSTRNTTEVVGVSYGSGFFAGDALFDTISLSSSPSPLTAHNQSLGSATVSSGFEGFDGILGLGPTILTNETVTNAELVPTVIDTLFAQRKIKERVVGVAFTPLNEHVRNGPRGSGSVSFGAVDHSQFVGPVSYVPVTSTFPSSLFFGVDASFKYGSSHKPLLGKTAGIVDTGTSLLLLATDAYTRYIKATGATFDTTVGLLRLTARQYRNLKPLQVRIGAGGETYVVTPDAQILPRTLNVDVGGKGEAYYLIVADLGQESGTGLDFVLGQSFLERFYSVYDSGANGDDGKARVGFAYTRYTFSLSNGLNVTGSW